MSNNLRLDRNAFTPWGTFGVLEFPTYEKFYTVERPWLDNEAYVSCIPDGVYELTKRHSPVVHRTSGGEFPEGWEITDVPGRTFIMIHPANWMGDLAGCIGVGMDYRITQNRSGEYAPSVMNSRKAFQRVMELMDQHNSWTLDIRPYKMAPY
jgi:hypothetical protein